MDTNSTPDLERLREAWFDEGINPAYHRQQKRLLYVKWPSLYHAIREIMGDDV